MIPYSKPFIDPRAIKAHNECLRRGQIDPAEQHERFREALANFLGVNQQKVLLTNSCTTALALAWRVFDGGAGRKCWVPVLTWPSTYSEMANRIWYQQTSEHRSMLASGDIYVHVDLWGHPSRGTSDSSIRCIRDRAQNLTPEYPGCSLHCYSFGPLKEVTTLRGGALVGNFSEELETFIDSGTTGRLLRHPDGRNAQMLEPHAAMGLIHLETHSQRRQQRQELVRWYMTQWTVRSELQLITDDLDSCHLCVAIAETHEIREYAREYLASKGIATGIHYPFPMHLDPKLFPDDYELSRKILTLPLHDYLTRRDVEYICHHIRAMLSGLPSSAVLQNWVGSSKQ